MNVPFSVLMSVYIKDDPSFLNEAFKSIFTQTLQPDEIVLIKDGPLSIELDNIISLYSSTNTAFRIIENKSNLGLGLSLAKGVLLAKNELIIRMDADDILPSIRFEKMIAKISEGYDIVSSWTLFFEDDLANVIAIKKRPEFHEDIVKLAKRRSPISHAASVFRKSSVIKAGNYQDVGLYEDYHLWIRMIMSGAIFYNIQEPLYYVRTSQKQIGRRGGWKYALNEIKAFRYFHEIGFYSIYDLFFNIVTHTSVRFLPVPIRGFIIKRLWKRS